MAEIVPFMTQTIETEMNVDVLEVYYDWNFRPPEDCTGSIWLIVDVPVDEQESFSWPTAVNKNMLHRQIENMSTQAQKQPDAINLFWLGQREILVERTGIFLNIEKALLDYGHEETLKVVKRPLEKKIFDRHVLESVLHATIQETFVDWHMEKDKGYLLIYLERENRGRTYPNG